MTTVPNIPTLPLTARLALRGFTSTASPVPTSLSPEVPPKPFEVTEAHRAPFYMFRISEPTPPAEAGRVARRTANIRLTRQHWDDIGVPVKKGEIQWDKLSLGLDDLHPATKRLLQRRFAHSTTSAKKIEQYRRPTQQLYEWSQTQADPQGFLKAIRELVDAYLEREEQYRQELQFMRNREYGNSFFGIQEKYSVGYPTVADCIRLLAEMLHLLEKILQLLQSAPQNPQFDRWIQKIQKIFDHKDVQRIRQRAGFVQSVATKEWDPYYLLDDASLEEEKQSLQRQIDDHYNAPDVLHEKIDRVRVVQARKEKLSAADRQALAEFGELTEEFSLLWEINTTAGRGNSEYPKRKGDRYSFLRQFPNGVAQTVISHLDLALRGNELLRASDCQFLPIATQAGTVRLQALRNPLFDNAVPVDVCIDATNPALLLTGPNMGGKTALARGITLAVLMNQAGLPVPVATADGASELAVFHSIHTVFPSLHQGTPGFGYFESLVEKISKLIPVAQPGDLVVLDEVPTGTDYHELTAVASVLIEDLVETGATVIVTSHLKEAMRAVSSSLHLTPYQFLATEDHGTVTRTYEMAAGVSQNSHAISLAAQSKFPPEVIDIARMVYDQILHQQRVHIDELPAVTAVADGEGPQIPRGVLSATLSRLYPERSFVFPYPTSRMVDRVSGKRRTLASVFSELGAGAGSSHSEGDDPDEESQPIMNISPLKYTGALHAAKATAQSDAIADLVGIETAGLVRIQDVLRLLAPFVGRLPIPTFGPKKTPQEDLKWATDLTQRLQALQQLLDSLDFDSLLLKAFLQNLQQALSDLDNIAKNYKESLTDDPDESARQEAVKQLFDVQKADYTKAISDLLYFLDEDIAIALRTIELGLSRPQIVETERSLSITGLKPLETGAYGASDDSAYLPNAVPQSFSVDPTRQVMVLTGPNSSGKTVFGRNVYIAALLAREGLYVSGDYRGSDFDEVYYFSGGHNVSGRGESYFQNILNRYSSILKSVTPNSLVILDEMQGTDNFELAALQLAILTYLKALGCTVIFNTHIRDGIKDIADQVGIAIWKTDIDFDPESETVEFHYTVSPDPELAEKSHGIAVTRKWFNDDQVQRIEERLAA